MLPISAADSITLAIEHTRQQLFQPFRLGQWTRLAFVGMLAGELGANGCNRSNFRFPTTPGAVPHAGLPDILRHGGLESLGIDHALLAVMIGALAVAGLAIAIILMYIGSVMRFVLFDSILSRQCHIRQGWSRRLTPGWRYFVWKLLYIVLNIAVLVVLLGIPLAFAFSAGWFKNPRAHLPALLFGGTFFFLALMALFLISAVIFVLTKDFVIPQMALEDLDAMEAWRRLWPMMQAELGAYAGYIVMKIVLTIVVGILIAIASVILTVFFAVPTIALGAVAIITGKSAGLVWNVYTITLAVVVGCVVFAVFLYLLSLISVPAIIFFPAYSMYFFAARYPRLALPLYPASAATQVPASVMPTPP
jgi:hypothetical protein